MARAAGMSLPVPAQHGTIRAMSEQIRVVNNPSVHQFELIVDDAVAGYVRYREDGDRIVLTFTEIDSAFAGRGFGSTIARGTLDLIRESGRPLVLDCPFLARWVARNPEYADLPVEIRSGG